MATAVSPPSQLNYNPGIYPGRTGQSGWTVPVPNRVSIEYGQVYFHYDNATFSRSVPVSGINPYSTFNGMNGMPHWTSMGLSPAGIGLSTYNNSPSNYSPASPFSQFGLQQSPILVSSIYNANTGTQIFTNSLNSFGGTSAPIASFTNGSFGSNYFNTSYETNYSHRTNYSPPTNSSTNQLQQTLRTYGLNPATMDLSRNLTNTGRDQFSAGRLQKALEAYNRAIPIGQLANDKVGQAVTHASIAQTYLAMGEGRQALEHFNQAFQMSSEVKDVKLQTMAMRGIGAAHLASGENNLALDAYAQARILAAGDQATEAEILSSMGWVYQSSGELQQALGRYQEALALVVKSGNQEAELKSRVGIGLLYQSLGEANKSLDQYRDAIRLAKSPGETAGILISAGDIYQHHGRAQKALDCYNNAISLMRESGNKIGEAAALIGIARTYGASLGEVQTSLDYYADALNLTRAVGNRAGEAGALAGIGELYFFVGLRGYSLGKPSTVASVPEKAPDRSEPFITIKGGFRSGDFPKAMKHALRYYEEALAVMTSLGNRVGEVGILTNIGLTYDSWNKPREALAAYHKAIDGLEGLRTAARLEEFRTSLAQQANILYQRGVLLHLRLGQKEEAFTLSERARARTFLDQMGNARLDVRRGADKEAISREQALRQRLAALEAQLASELMQPITQLNREAIQALETHVTAGRKEYEDLLTYFKASNPEYASLISVDSLKFPQVQSLLAPNATLVSYFVTPELTVAFVVTRDSLSVSKLSVTERQLTAAINSFCDFPSLDEEVPPSLKQLYKWLIAPLRSQLKTPLIGFVPYGVLHRLPFAALTDGKRYLADDYTIFNLPSASALPFIQRQRRNENNRILVLAYGKGKGQSFLPYVEEEAEAVAKLYQTQARIGDAATKAALSAAAGDVGILHLAAHYRPNTANPLFSQLLMAPGKNGNEALELHEVYELDLRHASLVVISACQTQIGAQSRGDDIIALNRAFMYAGTPTAIASLWSVEDKPTVELMTSFYTHLKEGMGKASALRIAQAETRAKHPHPYYWAGFVLTGNPGE